MIVTIYKWIILLLYKHCFCDMWLIICFKNWSNIYVNPLTWLYVRINVELSLARVRCWYLLTGLYVRICDMCICYTILWSIFYMCFRMILRFDYICIKWIIICFGKLYLISLSKFVKSKYSCFAWLYFVVYCV